MGDVINFKKEQLDTGNTEANVEEVKAMLDTNLHLKNAIKIISGIEIDREDVNEADLLETYKQDSIKAGKKFVSLGELDERTTQYYYQLLQLGYRTFGAEFFKQMAMNSVNCTHMFIGIWALINGIENMSEGMMMFQLKNLAYESLDLTDEQKAQFEAKYKELTENPLAQFEEMSKQLEEELANKNEPEKK